MKKVKQSRKGSKTYSYWMASWRENGKTRNVHLGSARKMDVEQARQMARKIVGFYIIQPLVYWSEAPFRPP